MTALVIADGDPCPSSGCQGRISIAQGPCYCGACRMPPCWACEGSRLECSWCGWRDGDELTAHEVIAARRGHEMRAG